MRMRSEAAFSGFTAAAITSRRSVSKPYRSTASAASEAKPRPHAPFSRPYASSIPPRRSLYSKPQ